MNKVSGNHLRMLQRVKCFLFALVVAGGLGAVTLEELRRDKSLTPDKFARYFSNFEYQFRVEIQPPEVFLETGKGDCDDFATLADLILREKGFKTRLIAVRMPGLTHVVCYVQETKSYLDFNNRSYMKKTVSSGDALTDIAKKVAKSFDASWTSASEFTYQDGIEEVVATVSKTDSGSSTPAEPAPKRKIVIDF